MKNKDFLTSRKIAHRGIHHTYLENTLLAFQSAIQKKYSIELDVRLSSDEEVVVFHDYSLKRIFGINRNIHELSLKEIKKYHSIPTLEEALALIDGQVPVFIELKFDRRVGILEKRVAKLLESYPGKFAIFSFNPLSILWFRLNYPQYIRGYFIHSLLPENFLIHFFLNRNMLKNILNPDFVGVDLNLLKKKKIQKLRKKYFIIGYTIQSEEEYQNYQMDADNFIFDRTNLK